MQAAFLEDLCFAILESPNLQQVLRADGEENSIFSNFMNLFDCLPMDRKSSKDVIHTIDLYKNDGALGEADDQESIDLITIWVWMELVIWISWGIFVEVRHYFTIEFGWLCVCGS